MADCENKERAKASIIYLIIPSTSSWATLDIFWLKVVLVQSVIFYAYVWIEDAQLIWTGDDDRIHQLII